MIHGINAKRITPGSKAAKNHEIQVMLTPSSFARPTATMFGAMAVINIALVIILTWNSVNNK